MTDSLTTIESRIAEHRASLDAWLKAAYADMPDRPFYGEMDASYPEWGSIESLAGSIFDQQLIATLQPDSLKSLLFFISRSNECGRIIAWFGLIPWSPFSNCGNLTYDDFLRLCDFAIGEPDDDCDYQLVSSFKKVVPLDDVALSRLHRFFGKKGSTTRRYVLNVFAARDLPQTVDLAKTLWETDSCEFAKLDCLHILKRVESERELFDVYLAEYLRAFAVDERDYRQLHVDELTR